VGGTAMMGRGHATMGVAAWVSCTMPGSPLQPLMPQAFQQAVGHGPSSQVWMACTSLAVAGLAMIPDLDHPTGGGTVGHSIPVAGAAASDVVRVLSGGKHRGFSHWLLFAAAMGWLAWLAAMYPARTPVGDVFWGLGLIAALALTSALNVFGVPGGRPAHVLAGLAAGAAVAWFNPAGPMLAAVMVGGACVVHMAGDTLTKEGNPWLGPFPWHLAIPLVGRAGSVRESVLTLACAVWAVWVGWESGAVWLAAGLALWALGTAGWCVKDAVKAAVR